MGVKNLLPNILPSIGKKIDLLQVSKNLQARHSHNQPSNTKQTSKKRIKLNNLRIAIDVSIWIFQVCHGNGCMLIDERQLSNYGRAELRQNKKNGTSDNDVGDTTASNELNEKENQYISICSSSVIKRIKTLQKRFIGCDLLLVFDGQTPPLKENECRERRQTREKASLERDYEINSQNTENDDIILMKKAKAARKAGATQLYKKIISNIFSFLKETKIPFMVAPYESDSQLAYLSKKNLVDLIITEDSDLIAYGAKAILFKVDKECKSGQLLERKDFAFTTLKFSLMDFSDCMLACMFVAAGCDYCNSLPGIGIGRARDIIQESFHSSTPDSNATPALQRIFQKLYSKSKTNINKNYEKLFLSAVFMFRNAIVFDPIKRKCVYFSNEDDIELLDYGPYADLWNDMDGIVGVLYGDDVVLDIVEGRICPKTLIPYEI